MNGLLLAKEPTSCIVYRAWWRRIEVAAKPVHNTLVADIKGVNSVPNTVVKGIEDEGDTMFLGISNSLTLNIYPI